MDSSAQLIDQLGLQQYTAEEQQRILEEYQMQIGTELTKDLSVDQLAEYQRIIDGDQATITWWLEQYEPNYRDTIAYKQLAEGFEGDPDKVPADKVYASLAWAFHNTDDIEQKVARVQAHVKQNAEQYK